MKSIIWILMTVSYGGTVSTASFPTKESCMAAGLIARMGVADDVAREPGTKYIPTLGDINKTDCLGPLVVGGK